MVVDGLPDLLRLPLLAGVDAAHDPLEGGEFLHHLGREVHLEQARGLDGVELLVSPPAELVAEGGREGHDALGLGGVAPELLLEVEALELLGAVGEAGLPVLPIEEAGVGEAGRHHPLVAGTGTAGRVVRTVHDGEEVRQEVAVPVRGRDGQGALVVAQAGREHLGRQLQEGVAEAPFHDAGDLADGRQLVEQGRIFDQRAAEGLGASLHGLVEHAAALLGADLDVPLGELAPVVLDAGRRGTARARGWDGPRSRPRRRCRRAGTARPRRRAGRRCRGSAAPRGLHRSPTAWSWPRRCRPARAARSRPAPRGWAAPRSSWWRRGTRPSPSAPWRARPAPGRGAWRSPGGRGSARRPRCRRRGRAAPSPAPRGPARAPAGRRG